jgi:hypothetical protein
LERDIRRLGAFFVFRDSNAVALGFVKTDLVSMSCMRYDIIMYLARMKIKDQTHYYIRETYPDGMCLKSRDVFHLGTDPSKHIIYLGAHGYYYDEAIEETLAQFGLYPDQDELDHIFWDFLDPEIKRVIRGFQRSFDNAKAELSEPHPQVHMFDKRRIHYLKFAQMDQRNLGKMPLKVFNVLHGKSRDEIEQYFLVEERILRPNELRTYVYTIFDLQRFFLELIATQRPDDLNQIKMDEFFVDAVCRLNDDEKFWAGMETSDRLQDYLIKYVIMYFDNEFPRRSLFQDYLRDFMNRHRTYLPPKKVRVNMEEAARLFETSWENLKQMDLKGFNRLYRKMALKHHPDKGGSSEKFVKLTKYYHGLLRKKTP